MKRIYRIPGSQQLDQENLRIKNHLRDFCSKNGYCLELQKLEFEYCFNFQLKPDHDHLGFSERKALLWLLTETFEPENCSEESSFFTDSAPAAGADSVKVAIEIGPRLAFSTAWSSNCLSQFEACGVSSVHRIERNRRYVLHLVRSSSDAAADMNITVAAAHEFDTYLEHTILDRMTECRYNEPLQSFGSVGHEEMEPVKIVPVLEEGSSALQRLNQERGLGFDDWDIDFYTRMFREKVGRNPTDVECFDMGQSNSEHSRHWFFSGKMVLNGQVQNETLFQMVKSTLHPSSKKANSNSVIAFHDNSSAIMGSAVHAFVPTCPDKASAMQLSPDTLLLHPILTAETHNFPCGVAPFPGAETGTGGRLRDVQATGRGAHTRAGISAYCVGQLHIPHHPLPWEQCDWLYPDNLASPLAIQIEASNGASDYGNKYGEPVVAGFNRSFGQRLPGAGDTSHNNSASDSNRGCSGERREWLKPIMFTAGVGQLDARHAKKCEPEPGMIICKIGGPAYRIGMGGGAASSRVQPSSDANSSSNSNSEAAAAAKLDFEAVQRGDAEMENRMNRVIRACVELGDQNPIISIHDQGAGGNGNVLKEIVESKAGAATGAKLNLDRLPRGDPSLSALELWGAEYQENNAFLVRPGSHGFDLVMALSERENCPVSAVGTVTNDGQITATCTTAVQQPDGTRSAEASHVAVFDLPLSLVLGDMPQKEYKFNTAPRYLLPLRFNTETASVPKALSRVLQLVDVGSKRFLTNKVDRCVSGLVAQQQCCGPLHIPLANCAVIAHSFFARTGGSELRPRGTAVSVGEQPVKGLIDNAAQARMTACEALSNLVFAPITALEDVKSSGNWMWAAKMDGEGVSMYTACRALRDCLVALGVGIDGGKDSLSMAAKAPLQRVGSAAGASEEIVKAPGQLTLTCYAECTDITGVLTPDLKGPSLGLCEGEARSRLVYVDLGSSLYRLGASALSTVYNQLGEDVPDISDFDQYAKCFKCIQQLNRQGLLLAGHDRSDGGLIVTLLEMAFAGNCGFEVTLSPFRCAAFSKADYSQVPELLPILFAEELGFIFEVLPEHVASVLDAFHQHGNHAEDIGCVLAEPKVIVRTGEVTAATNQSTDTALGPMDTDFCSMTYWRDVWESTSFALEKLQCDTQCVQQEQTGLAQRSAAPPLQLTFSVAAPSNASLLATTAATAPSLSLPIQPSQNPRIAVIRQEGSNGDREMLAAFHAAGFEAWDVNMRDLLSSSNSVTLDRFRGVIFCGGFSYADVNDSAKGWAGAIKFNESLLAQFNHFRGRPDSFSLGVCNGCQLLALLGWVPSNEDSTREAKDERKQPRFIHNKSGRFESRWSAVRIGSSPAVLLQGMEGSTLGVWVAHGEGRAYFPDPQQLDAVLEQQLAPLRYVDDNNQPTEQYPFNPNGSPHGIAALCSPDGRHLAMMPHPERCFLTWQLPYLPNNLRAEFESTRLQQDQLPAGPWFKLFQNARSFCGL